MKIKESSTDILKWLNGQSPNMAFRNLKDTTILSGVLIVGGVVLKRMGDKISKKQEEDVALEVAIDSILGAEDDILMERAKIKTSLRAEIRDLQDEKRKLEEYMEYGFTPPAWWEYRTHEQKSIEPFFSSRLNRMRQFQEKELDRIGDINAQIEDLISYLNWIDEYYGTREESQ